MKALQIHVKENQSDKIEVGSKTHKESADSNVVIDVNTIAKDNKGNDDLHSEANSRSSRSRNITSYAREIYFNISLTLKHKDEMHKLDKTVSKFESRNGISTSSDGRSIQKDQLEKVFSEITKINDVFKEKNINILDSKMMKKLDELSATVQTMQTNLKSHSTENKNIRDGLDIVIKLDLDSADKGGIMIKESVQVILNEIPLVLISTLINGEKNSTGSTNVNNFVSVVMQKVNSGNLEVFQNNQTGILLFLPKSYPPTDVLNRLQELGFDDKNLTKIPKESVEKELKTPSENKATMDGLYQMFDKDSTVKKRVLLEGHGEYSAKDEGGHIAGLNIDKYQNLLGFLNEVGTEYLSVVSCYAAGRNAMKHVAKDNSSNEQKLEFPVVLHASSDMPAELLFRNSKNFFESVNTMLNNKAPMTEKTFSNLMQGIENGLREEITGCHEFMHQLQQSIPKKGITVGVFLKDIQEKDPELAAGIEYFKHIVPGLHKLLSSPDAALSRTDVNNVQKGHIFKLQALNNSALVMFPRSPGIQANFRSINSYGNCNEFTFIKLQKSKEEIIKKGLTRLYDFLAFR
ncbi:MAG: hypothetical protein H0W50_08840 [Parachlamydiaceae bacterium]|nr:hypothetical protein [Parachlamydiaceae bacterium]